MEEWNPAAEVAKSIQEGKEARIWAICSLVSLATCYLAIKVLAWNDCAMHAATIGIPTTFTLDNGCLVLSSSGAYSADGDYNYEVQHPFWAVAFGLLGVFSFVFAAIYGPRFVKDSFNDNRVARNIARGFHHYERVLNQLTSIREVQSNQHHRKVYQLRQLCFNLITIETRLDKAFYPNVEPETEEDARERVKVAIDNAYLPDEEFDTLEEARVRMELIAPIGKWIAND